MTVFQSDLEFAVRNGLKLENNVDVDDRRSMNAHEAHGIEMVGELVKPPFTTRRASWRLVCECAASARTTLRPNSRRLSSSRRIPIFYQAYFLPFSSQRPCRDSGSDVRLQPISPGRLRAASHCLVGGASYCDWRCCCQNRYLYSSQTLRLIHIKTRLLGGIQLRDARLGRACL
jgi:hypothetical protein